MIRIIFEHYPKEGQEQLFIEQWQKGSDVIQSYPGARGTKLFRKIDDPKVFYAIAEWDSKEMRDSAMEAIKKDFPNADEILHGYTQYTTEHKMIGVLENIAESTPETILTDIVAGVVIKLDGKYLLVQEKNPKAYGLWNFPAGKVDKGDTIEQTAVREAKEEVGLDVELIRKIGIYQNKAETPPKHAFEAKIVGGEVHFPEDEILDVKWFSFAEIKSMADKLRSEWILEAINALEAGSSGH